MLTYLWTNYLEDLETALRGVSPERVWQAVEVLRNARTDKASAYILGNGGSAATASHFANDLLKVCGVRAFALGDMTPALLAYGNDYGYENMFSGLLKRLLVPRDVVVVISGSGESLNVAAAVKLVREHQIADVKIVAFLGHNYNCTVAKLVPDVLVHVPFDNIRIQEDCHSIICHVITGVLENAPAQAVGVLQSA